MVVIDLKRVFGYDSVCRIPKRSHKVQSHANAITQTAGTIGSPKPLYIARRERYKNTEDLKWYLYHVGGKTLEGFHRNFLG
jgi:hypothetical protein